MLKLTALTIEQQQELFLDTLNIFKLMLTCKTAPDFDTALNTHRAEFTLYRASLDKMIDKDVSKLVETSIVGLLSSVYFFSLMGGDEPTVGVDDRLDMIKSWILKSIDDVTTLVQSEEELKFFGKSEFMFVDLNKEQIVEAQRLILQHKIDVQVAFENINAAPALFGLDVPG
jgi:hypothetical protein